MPVATWADLVIGVDFHVVLIPTPGGVVPTRLPHVFMGLCGDPVGYAMSAATYPLISLVMRGKLTLPPGPILDNGRPRMTTSSHSSNLLLMPHIPMGGPFAKTPKGSGSHLLGSRTVLGAGSSVVRNGERVFTCSDPVALPTSQVITLPKGPLVVVGGESAINPSQIAYNWLSGRITRGLFRGVGALARFVGRMARPRLLAAIQRIFRVCTSDPIDVASGAVLKDAVDFEIAGPIPLEFKRSYGSFWASRRTDLGYGWSHSFDRGIWLEDDGLVYRAEDGRELVFDPRDLGQDRGAIALGASHFDPITGFTLTRLTASSWEVETPDGLVETHRQLSDEPFDPLDAAATKPVRSQLARCCEIRTRDGQHAIALTWQRGRLVAARTSGGVEVRFQHDQQGRIIGIRLPDPDVAGAFRLHAGFAYSPEGDLIAAQDALGKPSQYRYKAHLLVHEIWRNGVQFCWGYDGLSSQSRCIRTWGYGTEEDGRDEHGLPKPIFNQRLMYDALNRKTWRFDSDNNVTEYHANELGLVTFIREPLGGITRRAFDGYRLTSETNALGHTWRWTHDERGRLVATEAPDGGRTETRYESRFPDLPTYHRDERGGEWHTTYDLQGRSVAVDGPEGLAIRWVWERGLIRRVETTGRAPTIFDYDENGWCVSVGAAGAAARRRRFDRRGQVIEEAFFDATTGLVQGRRAYQRDLVGRLVRVEEPDGNVRNTSYDPEGNVLSVSDQNGAQRFVYRGADWLGSRDDNGARIAFDYTAEGELLELRNELGHPYRFVYDKSRRVLEEHGFDIRAYTRYKRDAAGQITELATFPRRGKAVATTKYEIDPMGRLVKRTLPDGAVETFTYDAGGEMLSAINPTIAVSFKRDKLGRVLSEQQGEHSVSYRYDAGGSLAGLTSSLGAHMAVTRDAHGAPVTIYLGGAEGDRLSGRQTEIRLHHDAFGREVARDLPGGIRSMWQWDAAGRPRALMAGPTSTNPSSMMARVLGEGAASQISWRRDYFWGPDDRLTAMVDSRFGKSTYRHDERGRIYSETTESGTQYRVSDPVGNVFRSPDKSDRSYTFGGMLREIRDPAEPGHQVDRRGPATQFEYDLQGRLTKRVHNRTGEGWAYEWDGAGNLREAAPLNAEGSGPQGGSVRFDYDALSRRVSKAAGQTVIHWIWAGNDILHQETRVNDDARLETWYSEPDSAGLLAVAKDGAQSPPSLAVVDHLGTPTAVYSSPEDATHLKIDLQGAFETLGDNAESVPWRWPGQWFDAETGLTYNRFRYYDPEVAGYISSDPIGLDGDLNVFRYVEDPLIWTDFFGLAKDCQGREVWLIKDKFSPGSYESRQLRRFLAAWNQEIAVFGGAMTRRRLSLNEEKASDRWKELMRRRFPARFADKVVGHTPDAAAGGPAAGGRAMALSGSVNSTVGGQLTGKPVGYTYNLVRATR